jgi:hypothetical protein
LPQRNSDMSLVQDWDAIDTKALGALGAAVAALAALAAFHKEINHLWWLPAIGLLVSCGLFALVIRPYDATGAPDLLRFAQPDAR